MVNEVFRAGLAPCSVAALMAVVTVVAPPASAQFSQTSQIEQVEREFERTQRDKRTLDRERASLDQREADLQAEVRALRAAMSAAARAVQEHEGALTGLERQLRELEAREGELVSALSLEQGRLGDLMAALQRLARQPTQALMAQRGSTLDRVRGAMLLSIAVPALEDRAETLRGELTTLSELRDEIGARRDEADIATAALKTEQDRIATLLDRKSRLYRSTESERDAIERRLAALTGRAKSLSDLMGRIEGERLRAAEAAREREIARAREEEARRARDAARTQAALDQAEALAARGISPLDGFVAPPPVATRLRPEKRPDGVRDLPRRARPLLRLPVAGSPSRGFGDKMQLDQISKGMAFSTRQGAQVVAPFDGQVVFAGDFRGYGRILILEHGGGYHTVLAGFDRLDAAEGEWLLAGEPIGTVGVDERGTPSLYLELRREGQAINPLPWLASRDGKVTG